MQRLDNMIRKFFQYALRTRVVFYVGWFFLLLTSSGFWVVEIESRHLAEVKLEAQQLQLAVQQAESRAAMLPALAQQQQKLLADLEQALPNAMDTAITAITVAAQKAQLATQAITPSVDIATDHYAQTPVQISAVGNYQQLLLFLQQLQQSNTLLVPGAITVKVVETQLQILLTLNHYHHFTGLLQPFTTVTIAAAPSLPAVNFAVQRNPFLPPIMHPWRTVIMTGYLTAAQKQWALLQLADGSMIAAAAGDHFNDYQTTIQQVTPRYVVLAQSLPTANGVQAVTQTITLQETENAP